MGRTGVGISWRGETSQPTAPSWVNLPTHSRSQSMAKATSQSYALRPESSVTIQKPVPVKWRLVFYTGWMPSPHSPPREAHAARVDGTTPRWYRYMLEVLTPLLTRLRAQQAETGGNHQQRNRLR